MTQTTLAETGEGDEAGPSSMATINYVMEERPTTNSPKQSTSRGGQVTTVNQQASGEDQPILIDDDDGYTRDHFDVSEHSQPISSEGQGHGVSRKVASQQELNGAEVEKVQAKIRLFVSSNECMQLEKEKLKNQLEMQRLEQENLRQRMRQDIEMHELQLKRLRASIRHDEQTFLIQKENLTLQRKKLQLQIRKQSLEADPVEDADDVTLF